MSNLQSGWNDILMKGPEAAYEVLYHNSGGYLGYDCKEGLWKRKIPGYLVFPAGIEVLIPDKPPDRQENLPIWRR